jgi:hypothetical protein
MRLLAGICSLHAYASRSQEVIHINTSSAFGTNTGGIALSSPQEMADFIDACRLALRQKANDTTTPASELGSSTDFSRRIVTV